MVVFGQCGSDRAKWLYTAKEFVFGQKLYLGEVVVPGKSGCIRSKWLYSVKSGCIRAKVVVFGQK